MSLIGLDIGTTGSKALAFDENGARISEAYKEYPFSGDIHEINPDDVWLAVREVLGKAARLCAGDPPKALAVSSFGESVVPLDEAGRVLHNAILYSDPRGMQQCAGLVETLGKSAIMQRTGVNPHPMYSVCKIGWYRDCLPDVFKRTKRYMMLGDYILWKLGAEPSIDYSLASRTMAFNVSALNWDQKILDACGIHASQFSRAVRSGTAIGRISAKIADDLNLPRDLLLVTGGHDQVCAAVGAGVLQEGMAIDGTGTVECITPIFFRPVLEETFLNNNYACVPYAVPGAYVTYAFNFTGGSLLRWFRDNFARLEIERAALKGCSAYDLLNEKASPLPSDLLVIPHFAGSGTPQMDTLARGAILGLQFETDSSTVYRALMEGITYEMAYNIETLESNDIRINKLRAVGGGARSGLWLKIKANITGCTIQSMDVEEAGAAGAAMMAGVAAGTYTSLREAAPAFVRIRREIEPDPKERTIYLENYSRYKEARNRISGLYGR